MNGNDAAGWIGVLMIGLAALAGCHDDGPLGAITSPCGSDCADAVGDAGPENTGPGDARALDAGGGAAADIAPEADAPLDDPESPWASCPLLTIKDERSQFERVNT